LGRNIVFLMDSSSSMKEKTKSETHFRKAIQAIRNVLTNPDKPRPEDHLTIIFFWVDLLNSFKTKIVYNNVPLSTRISPQKLDEFGEPPSYAGTGLEQGLNFAVEFLADKQGENIIKLITDNSVKAQNAREKNLFRLAEKGIRLDCIVIGEKRNASAVVGTGSLGQVFEESDVDAVSSALLS
jgi:hypothetical protein